MAMEHLNSILFQKSGPGDKQHTYQSVSIQSRYFSDLAFYALSSLIGYGTKLQNIFTSFMKLEMSNV